MEDIKNSISNVDLNDKKVEQVSTEECVCDLVNNNIDIINQMKAKIAELEYMIQHNSRCFCGRLFIKHNEEKH